MDHRINQIQLISKKFNIHNSKKYANCSQGVKPSAPSSTTRMAAVWNALIFTTKRSKVKDEKSKKSSSDIKHIQVHQDKTLHAETRHGKTASIYLKRQSKHSHHSPVLRHSRSAAQGCGSRGSHCSAGAGWPREAGRAAMGCEQRPSSGCSSESQQLLRSGRLWRTPAGSPPAQLFGAWWSSSGSWWRYQFCNRNTDVRGVLEMSISNQTGQWAGNCCFC